MKGSNVSWAISIIDGLRASLNLDKGGALAGNLDGLYEYMTRTLVEANLRNDADKLTEVESLLNQIRGGWKGIEQQVNAQSSATVHNEVGPSAVGLG